MAAKQRNARIWIGAAVAIGLVVAGAAWASLDSPDGEPPYGIDFQGTSGPGYAGIVTFVFQDVDLFNGSSGFDSVTRLRKGGELHAFHLRTECGSYDPCSLCTNQQGKIDIAAIQPIQLCLQQQIAPEVIADFNLANGTQVLLKNMSDFVSEFAYGDNSVRVVAADIDVTAK